MRKLLVISLAAFVLSSCGTRTIVIDKTGSGQDAPVISVAPQQESSEDNYVSSVLQEYPAMVNRIGIQPMIQFGKLICTEIDNGMTLEQLLLMAIEYEVNAEMIGFLTASAIRNFCPHNQWFIDAALNA